MQLHKPGPAKCVRVSFKLFKFEPSESEPFKSEPFTHEEIEPINVWDTDLGTVRTIVLHALRQHCAGS